MLKAIITTAFALIPLGIALTIYSDHEAWLLMSALAFIFSYAAG